MGPRRGDFQSAAWLLTQGKLEAGTNVTMRKDRILIKDLISYTMKYRTNIQHLSLTASLYVTKTLKKEGRAFRNIDNKKHIFPTVKPALLLLFDKPQGSTPRRRAVPRKR